MNNLSYGHLNDQDPEYILSDPVNANQQKILEKNARANAADQIKNIIEKEFSKEISNKKSEINKINKALSKALKVLHYVRYATVTDFYNKNQCQASDADPNQQSRIHPAVKQLLAKSNEECLKKTSSFQEFHDNVVKRPNKPEILDKIKLDDPPKKVPRYIPPVDNLPSSTSLARATNKKIKRRLVVGNISKWIHPDWREGNATHKWILYVRDVDKTKDIGEFISKIRFFLDPSYKPNDVVDVNSSPFYLSRRGWGEFPARIQLHFKNSKNKSVDIIHHLKLDRTFTGLQTIGSETVVDVWIRDTEDAPRHSEQITDLEECEVIDNSTKTHNTEQTIVHGMPQHLNDHDYFGSVPVEYSSANIDNLNEVSEIDNIGHRIEFECKVEPKKENFSDNDDWLDDQAEDQIEIKENVITYTKDAKNAELINHLRYVKQLKTKDLQTIIKYLVSQTPLVTNKVIEAKYRMLHPYDTISLKEFHSHSLGKQKSLERCRANTVRNLLKKIVTNDERIWSVKEIILWARRYGYTPSTSIADLSSRMPLLDISGNNETKCTSTIADQMNKWLKSCSNKSSKQTRTKHCDNKIEEIDIVGDEVNGCDYLSPMKKQKASIFLEIPQEKKGLQNYVYESASDVGIKLNAEEIITGVVHSTSSLLISRAVECLVEDILRLSYSNALDKKTDSSTLVIRPADILSSLVNKEEFDIFTNSGLGLDS